MPTPCQVVLLQELDRYNRLVRPITDLGLGNPRPQTLNPKPGSPPVPGLQGSGCLLTVYCPPSSWPGVLHLYLRHFKPGPRSFTQRDTTQRATSSSRLTAEPAFDTGPHTAVDKMLDTLKNLQKALTGEIGMSTDLDMLATSLFNGALPAAWAKMTAATEKKLGSWMLWFERRFKQYKAWVEKGEPIVMWLSGLHIPETYTAALVQTACRTKGWPLDKSTLYSKVTAFTDPSEVGEKLQDGAYIEGLYLEGAGWDVAAGKLRRQDPKVLVTELPILQVIPIEASKLKLQNTFETPVYVTQSRRNAMGVGLVFEANLSTTEHSSHWVLQAGPPLPLPHIPPS